MTPNSSLLAALMPTGRLRASINLGNAVLANQAPGGGEPFGVSIDLARELGRRLGSEVELVVFNAAAKSVAAVTAEQADFGFFAVDPLRGEHIAFTAPYVLIEGWYLVRDESPIRDNAAVDQAGRSVLVAEGSAYDLFLTRELKAAEIVRTTTSQDVVKAFIEKGTDVAAGVKQQLEADIAQIPGMRLLDERFMVIQQAMGLAKSRGEEATVFLRQFVEEMKASGFVAASLARHGIQGAAVAPAAGE